MSKIITYLGKISFSIYLSHCYIIYLFGYLHIELSWTYKWLIVLCAGVCFIIVLRNILPRSLHKFLGYLDKNHFDLFVQVEVIFVFFNY